MSRQPNTSPQTIRVLRLLLEEPTAWRYGYEISQQTGLKSGTLYPILLRLEEAGWFVSRWETVDPSAVGRPRRRLYRLTPAGLSRASEVFASFGRSVLT